MTFEAPLQTKYAPAVFGSKQSIGARRFDEPGSVFASKLTSLYSEAQDVDCRIVHPSSDGRRRGRAAFRWTTELSSKVNVPRRN